MQEMIKLILFQLIFNFLQKNKNTIEYINIVCYTTIK